MFYQGDAAEFRTSGNDPVEILTRRRREIAAFVVANASVTETIFPSWRNNGREPFG